MTDAAEGLGRVWALRAASERVQERRFRRLAGELATAGADLQVAALALQASRDENRHAGLCARLASRFGWTEPIPSDDAVISWPAGMALADRVLYEVVVSCCLMESLNARLLVGIAAGARDGEVKSVATAILKDEVSHSRIGWAHLAFETGRRDCRGLSRLLPRMLADTVSEELLAPPPPGPRDEALLAYGELPLALRLEQFRGAAQELIFPGFERLGIDTAPARRWLESSTPTRPGPPAA